MVGAVPVLPVLRGYVIHWRSAGVVAQDLFLRLLEMLCDNAGSAADVVLPKGAEQRLMGAFCHIQHGILRDGDGAEGADLGIQQPV